MTTITCYRFSIDLNGARIDPNTRTIRQVSLISLGEAKGHNVFVDDKTLQQVFDRLTELGSLKVKADHGSGVLSTIGYVDQFDKNDKQVLGDFHVYESETEGPRIFEIARKNPQHLGMSLEFEGEDQKKDGKMFARCSDISAVALVSDPAANKSLFEKSNKNVDFNDKNDDNNNMAMKKLDDKPEAQAGDEAPKSPDSNSDFSKLMKRFDDMETRMSKYEEGASNKVDDAKPALPAINPNAEPKANNNGPTMANKEAGSVKGDEPAANPDGPWEEDEKKLGAIIEKASNLAVEKAMRQFGGALGVRSLPSRNAPLDTNKSSDKTFEVLVAEKQKELEDKDDKNPKNNAIVYCMKNYKKEYAAWRPVEASQPTRSL